MVSTEAKFIEATAERLGVTMQAKFVPFSQSRNAGEKIPSLNWKVSLTFKGRVFLTTDYMEGSGYCPSYKQNGYSLDQVEAVHLECERGKPSRISGLGTHTVMGAPYLQPSFAGVLASLLWDADAINYATFEEWASQMGFDTDSRKGEAMYKECLKIGLKLRNTLGESAFAELREACQDY